MSQSLTLCNLRSVALSLVVDSFEIFVSEQGNQGLLGRASKQQLETVFGKISEDEMIETIIQNGIPKPGESISKGFGGGNDSRCVSSWFRRRDLPAAVTLYMSF
ncbi:hypothetical protein DL93DRAFT_2137855 [Clavulina sp. PMI_390]|nr:hypothetical protein DL93DRAFT_2137855 [Clavulina sp. PMI_390]